MKATSRERRSSLATLACLAGCEGRGELWSPVQGVGSLAGLDLDLAVDYRRLAAKLCGLGDDRRVAVRPVVTVSCEGSRHTPIDRQHGAIPVELDLVNPLVADRCLKHQGRQHGGDEGGFSETGHGRPHRAAISRIRVQNRRTARFLLCSHDLCKEETSVLRYRSSASRLEWESVLSNRSVERRHASAPQNRPGRREALSAALEARSIVRNRRRQIDATSSWIVVQTDWEERLEAERETGREAIWALNRQ